MDQEIINNYKSTLEELINLVKQFPELEYVHREEIDRIQSKIIKMEGGL